jgi:hypothetical protein
MDMDRQFTRVGGEHNWVRVLSTGGLVDFATLNHTVLLPTTLLASDHYIMCGNRY